MTRWATPRSTPAAWTSTSTCVALDLWPVDGAQLQHLGRAVPVLDHCTHRLTLARHNEVCVAMRVGAGDRLPLDYGHVTRLGESGVLERLLTDAGCTRPPLRRLEAFGGNVTKAGVHRRDHRRFVTSSPSADQRRWRTKTAGDEVNRLPWSLVHRIGACTARRVTGATGISQSQARHRDAPHSVRHLPQGLVRIGSLR